ncbi:MAG: 30S ribosomal protein S21 [Thermodesulfobacteria bacterium]|nr:30S ribosomal protein S21 [Thermodesulfobacteriota bacterium]
MAGIIVREGESLEQALKRFKRLVEKTKILSEIKKREFYEKPGVRRRKKRQAARKKLLKKLKKLQQRLKEKRR